MTPGDPAGIGPEITWKAIQSGSYQEKGIHLLCVGSKNSFQKLHAPIVDFTEGPRSLSGELSQVIPDEILRRKDPFVWLLPAPETCPKGVHLEGFQSGWSIQKATELVLNQTAAALVTGPISKERFQQGGYPYPGHTEYLADLCQQSKSNRPKDSKTDENPEVTQEVTMMLANSQLRVSLVTIHMSLREVSAALTRQKIRRAVLQTVEALKKYWGISKPKVAVAALNPHAGEAGRFGTEEIDLIAPELKALNQAAKGHFNVFGPFPADTLFAQHILSPPEDRWDAVVCMYHDQGLIPVKLLDFHNTVNITLGLPIIRTSVDHGVGFDIAGKGIAHASSLKAAINLAAYFVQKRV